MENIHAGKSWREMFGGVFLALRWVVGKLGGLIVFLYQTGVFVWASQQLTRSKAQRSPSDISLSSLWAYRVSIQAGKSRARPHI